MSRAAPLLALLLAAACGSNLDYVRVQRLAVSGDYGDGQTVMSDAQTLQITVKIQDDASDFNTFDLMRLIVNGVDRTADMTIGGNYAVLTLDPPPIGTPQFVELFTRTGTVPLDSATYEAMAYTGPVLASVTPATARVGTQVTIDGSGFGAGALRVFFGGAEGTVDASTATSITATVPADAQPGLVFVLVGADAAEGLVAFQPLDDMDQPVPPSTRIQLHYVAPAHGGLEQVVQVGGLAFTDIALPKFNNRFGSRVFNVQTVDLPPVGEILTAFAVVPLYTDPGAGAILLREGRDSNELPFTVE